MCIIAIKKEGVDLPSDKTIETMFNANNDGAGFALKRKTGKTVLVSKGHMSLEDFMAALAGVKVKKSDIVLMHFRIKTAGPVSQRLTHPFIADKNPEVAEILKARTNQLVMCHNGTIHSFSTTERSDSSMFASTIMSSPVIKENLEDEVIGDLITNRLSKTRLAVLNPKKHKVYIFGDWSGKSAQEYKWNKDEETGMIYSNHSWISYQFDTDYGYSERYYGTGSHSDSLYNSRNNYSKTTEDVKICSQAELILSDVDVLEWDELFDFCTFHNMTHKDFMDKVAYGYIDYRSYYAMFRSWSAGDKKVKSSVNSKIGVVRTEDGFKDVKATVGFKTTKKDENKGK